jgi:transcriptional regulator with XRE-family HTH domain
MEQKEKTGRQRTIADFLIQKLKDEKHGLENAVAFLKAAFLSSAVDSLFYARRKAGLTQEQVGRKLGKKQAAIARWEADKEGKMSLSQYFDLAVACGKVPLTIALEPIENVRDFIVDHPEEAPVPELYYSWLKQRPVPVTVQTVAEPRVISPQSRSIQYAGENASTVRSVQQYREDLHQHQVNRYPSQPLSSRNRTSGPLPVLNQPLA